MGFSFVLWVKEGDRVNDRFPNNMTIDAVFDKYCDTVYRLAFARMKNRYDAEDVLQTVFLKLLKTDTVFSEEEHLKAWLLKVTVNSSKNLLTSAWMRLTDSMRDDITVDMPENMEVYPAVMALPAKYRTVIHLFYYEGYSCCEIAALTNTSEATVKTRLARARQRLSIALKGEVFDV